MAQLDKRGNYVPNKSVIVKQATVDRMKQMGMKAAIDKANSGTADSEFMEAAKRFYGQRIKPMPSSPTVTKTASTGTPAVTGDTSHYTGQVPKGSPAVIEEPASKSVSNNYQPGRKMT